MRQYSSGDKGPRANSAKLQGSTVMQDGGKARRSHRSLPKILELEPNSKSYEGSLEDPSLDEVLRVYEEEPGHNT